MKRWIVTAVDSGETCDGKARVLKVCNTREEAESFVYSDIEKWAVARAGMPIVVDHDKMSAKYNWKTLDDTDGCEWNIEEVDIAIENLNIEKAEKILIDNGVDVDEAEVVLQAIGYALLDSELYL